MLGGDIADQFHDDNRLADTGAAEETDFAAFGIRFQQVDDFDTGLEQSVLRILIR